MSKFFNETQKASQLAQQRLSNQDLDIKEILENVKHGSPVNPKVPKVQLQEYRKVDVGNGNTARLILEQDASAQAALEAYRGLRTKLMRVQTESGLRSITISSSIPNEGKTLTVMNLGLCYAQLPGQRVLVIDADLRTRGFTRLLGYPGTTGLAQVLTGELTPSEVILATNQDNFFVLPAGSVSTPPVEHFTGPTWQKLLDWCCESFKVILVDTPPILPLADFELISAACDGIVLVVRAHHGQRELIHKTARTLDPKKLLGIVLNAVDRNEKRYDGYDYGHR